MQWQWGDLEGYGWGDQLSTAGESILELYIFPYLQNEQQQKSKEDDFVPILQPQQYPHGMDCRWVIVGPPGHIVKLTWMSFNLEESHTCSYDYLAIFDNTTIPGTGRQTEWILIFSTYEHPHQPYASLVNMFDLKVVLWVSIVATRTHQT